MNDISSNTHMKNERPEVAAMMAPPPAISPEQNRAMVYWFRKILAGEVSFLERLSSDDWARLITFAQQHGIAPVLYHAIKDSPLGSLSDHSLHELRNIYLRSAHHNMLLYHELGRVLRALQKSDILVIVLKGACLAEAVYGNIALRPMGDADILVKKKDILKTLQGLAALGYSTWSGSRFKDWALTYRRHLPSLVGPTKLKIDVHSTIVDFCLPNFLEDEEIGNIWKRARPVFIGQTPVLMLSPEDLLLHLCLHLSMGHWYNTRLRDFLDLKKVMVCYKTSIDWGLLQERSRRWAVDRAVRLSLFLADRWVGLALPEGMQRDWRPEQIDPDLVDWIEKKTLGEIPGGKTMKLPEFIARKSVAEKMAVLWQSFFPPPSLLSQIYLVGTASWKTYFFYPVRWLSLFNRFGAIVWKSWLGDAEVNKLAQRDHDLRQWLANK